MEQVIRLDYIRELLNNVCSFEITKKAHEAGLSHLGDKMLAYDKNGDFCDGVWLAALGYEMYPLINISTCMWMIDNLKLTAKEIKEIKLDLFTHEDEHLNMYTLTIKRKEYSSFDKCDVFMLAYLDLKSE